MKKLVLYGAGGMGKETAILVEAINFYKGHTYDLLGYVVDRKYYLENTAVNGLPVLGDMEWLIQNKESVVCSCTIGRPEPRKRIMEALAMSGVTLETLIHPNVYIDPTVCIGEGTIIQVDSKISVNVSIGRGVFLNSDVTLGHDVIIDDYAVCNPRVQVSGKCRIGEAALIGAASFLNERIKVGKNSVVAPGSIVFRNVKDSTKVLGNPAHRIEI